MVFTLLKNNKTGFLLMAITALVVGIVFSFDPIPQDRNYHIFSDTLKLFGLPNFWNVVSNIPFLIVGLMGLYKLSVVKSLNIDPELLVAFRLLFIGVVFVTFGSIYYHLRPENETLLWDRLAISVCFMALFSIIIGEYVSHQLAKVLLLPLLFIGLSSVLYWYYTELNQVGDLRLYILVQYLPLVLIPVMLLGFVSIYDSGKAYWLLLACYVIAKFFEIYDVDVYEITQYIGGHPFKHVFAALGLYVLLIHYERRRSIK